MLHEIALPIVAAALVLASSARDGTPPKKTLELLERGRTSFQTNCAACHGPKGEGDGVAAAALNPKPRNFASTALKPTKVFETLGKGVPGTAMAAFTHLPEDERWALSYYVADLRGGKAKK